jgi:peroxiredoxin
MIKIEKRGFGFKITFSGILNSSFVSEIREKLFILLSTNNNPCSLYMVFQNTRYISQEVIDEIIFLRKFFQKGYLLRTTIILKKRGDEIIFRNLRIPFDKNERVIYSNENYNYEIDGINWLTREIEPDTKIYKKVKAV